LIRQSTTDGELVVDPFLGAGGTGVAAVQLGRRFMGNDTCAEAINISRDRLIAAGAAVTEGAPDFLKPAKNQLGLAL